MRRFRRPILAPSMESLIDPPRESVSDAQIASSIRRRIGGFSDASVNRVVVAFIGPVRGPSTDSLTDPGMDSPADSFSGAPPV